MTEKNTKIIKTILLHLLLGPIIGLAAFVIFVFSAFNIYSVIDFLVMLLLAYAVGSIGAIICGTILGYVASRKNSYTAWQAAIVSIISSIPMVIVIAAFLYLYPTSQFSRVQDLIIFPWMAIGIPSLSASLFIWWLISRTPDFYLISENKTGKEKT